MPRADYGFRRAVGEVISGFTIGIVVKVFASIFEMPWMTVLFNLLSIALIISLIDVMPFWSLSYLFGWLFGLIYIGPMFLSPLELILYLGITVFILYLKVSR